jgi:hypothetical protein
MQTQSYKRLLYFAAICCASLLQGCDARSESNSTIKVSNGGGQSSYDGERRASSPAHLGSEIWTRRTPISIRTHIAGLPHRLGQGVRVDRVFHIGQTLEAYREPTNQHDSNAVKLFSSHKFIGYVAKLDNLSIAKHLDAGGHVAVAIVSIDRHDPWKGVKIQIDLV